MTALNSSDLLDIKNERQRGTPEGSVRPALAVKWELSVKKQLLGFRNGRRARWRGGVACALALVLALAPATALAEGPDGAPAPDQAADSAAVECPADAAPADVPPAPAPELANVPPAPEPVDVAPAPEASDAAEEATSSLTLYFCEIMNYDDPSFDHPSGYRLLGTQTIDGLKVGDTVNAWDYIHDIPDFQFFDGWPREITVSADASRTPSS